TTYEIMDAETIGLERNQIVLGKHSGRHALRNALEELGFEVEGAALNTAFERFKEIADKKRRVTALDLEAIVSDEMRRSEAAFELESFQVEASSSRAPYASVRVGLPGGGTGEGSFTGDGPVDAFFSAINVATGEEARLKEYHVSAVTGGRDALGEVTVLLELGGGLASGQGISTDILEASGRAYLRALANALAASSPVEEAERHLEEGQAEPTQTP
ncbi:MAG TPA: alpha-isopropylmalate synthase regulatory domain-containing protein, partial [Thermoleophilaceae bacterium]|nr:alpha-isopropylmalate synthase regulatory domain-containing protein [Thermoleophilaceae bacterium]